MRTKIKFSAQGMRPIKLLALYRNVIAKMTSNTNLPTPIIALSDLTDKADEV